MCYSIICVSIFFILFYFKIPCLLHFNSIFTLLFWSIFNSLLNVITIFFHVTFFLHKFSPKPDWSTLNCHLKCISGMVHWPAEQPHHRDISCLKSKYTHVKSVGINLICCSARSCHRERNIYQSEKQNSGRKRMRALECEFYASNVA